jgi:hypothetical protein
MLRPQYLVQCALAARILSDGYPPRTSAEMNAWSFASMPLITTWCLYAETILRSVSPWVEQIYCHNRFLKWTVREERKMKLNGNVTAGEESPLTLYSSTPPFDSFALNRAGVIFIVTAPLNSALPLTIIVFACSCKGLRLHVAVLTKLNPSKPSGNYIYHLL